MLRLLAYMSAVAAAVGLVRRDIDRRRLGIARRSPADILANFISTRFRFDSARWLAAFVVNHKSVSYALGLVALFLLFKYQQFLRRYLVRSNSSTVLISASYVTRLRCRNA
jgi:hypothetical protein